MKLVRFETNRSIESGQAMFKQRIEDCQIIFNKYKEKLIKRNCPVCNSSENTQKDIFHNTFSISECEDCRTEFINPCPPQEALEDYYSNGISNMQNIEMWEKRKKQPNSDSYHDHRIIALQGLITDESQMSVLEVGSGSGVFLEKAKTMFSKNISFEGIDLDPNAAKEAEKKGLKVTHGNIESLAGELKEQFDVIMHFELIEHLIDPISFLKACKKILKTNGKILFTTPNGDGLDNRAIGTNFKGRMIAHSIFPPMHLNNFTTTNIYHLLLSLGYKIREISTPGNLDVDMINVHDQFDKIKPPYNKIIDLKEEQQAELQEVLKSLKVSGHMLVVAQN